MGLKLSSRCLLVPRDADGGEELPPRDWSESLEDDDDVWCVHEDADVDDDGLIVCCC